MRAKAGHGVDEQESAVIIRACVHDGTERREILAHAGGCLGVHGKQHARL